MKLFYQICKLVFYIILIILILEFFFGIYRNFRRQTTYQKAVKRSKQINKPLIVIGSPNAGFMNSIYSVYGCGDVCVDLVGCKACKISIKGNVIDVLKKLPNNSSVIYESCVLDVMNKQDRIQAFREINRVAEDNYFRVRINPTVYVNLIKNIPLIRDGISFGIRLEK